MKSCDKFVTPRSTAVFATMCAAAIALPFLADAEPIAPSDYERTMDIKFSGYAGTSTMTNFPELIRLSETRN